MLSLLTAVLVAVHHVAECCPLFSCLRRSPRRSSRSKSKSETNPQNPLKPCTHNASVPRVAANLFGDDDDVEKAVSFELRKKALFDSINHLDNIRSRLPPQQHIANSVLLVVNGKHTLFDSVCGLSNSSADDMLVRGVKFFRSPLYADTLNVVRPGFMRFVAEIHEIIGTAPLTVIVHTETDTNHIAGLYEQIDELISVLAFIESCYNYNQRRSSALNLKTLEFDALVLEGRRLSVLMNYVPVLGYKKVIILDHDGIWPEVLGVHANQTWYESFEQRVVPIHPTAFRLGDAKAFTSQKSFRRRVFDSYLHVLSSRMGSLCCQLPDGIRFANRWITDIPMRFLTDSKDTVHDQRAYNDSHRESVVVVPLHVEEAASD